MNNFKELEKAQEEKYKDNINEVKNKIDSNLGTMGVFSAIVDMYLSKVINYIVSLSGGSEDKLSQNSED